MRENQLQLRIRRFVEDVVKFTRLSKPSIAGEILHAQLLRSAISVSLNYAEARSSSSLKDFINKLSICSKELTETQTNLELIKTVEKRLDINMVNSLLKEVNELLSIFIASINTCRKRLKKI